jgi:hypothetical protein
MIRDPFEYLLNAMEAAGQSSEPALAGYGDKRQAVLKTVVHLRANLAAYGRHKEGCTVMYFTDTSDVRHELPYSCSCGWAAVVQQHLNGGWFKLT